MGWELYKIPSSTFEQLGIRLRELGYGVDLEPNEEGEMAGRCRLSILVSGRIQRITIAEIPRGESDRELGIPEGWSVVSITSGGDGCLGTLVACGSRRFLGKLREDLATLGMEVVVVPTDLEPNQ